MKRWNKRKVKRALWQFTYCLGTAAATAAVLYVTLPIWLGILIFATVAAHEWGHYFAAKKTNQDPWVPFFIPLFYMVLGGTTVKGKDPNHLMTVALAGPMFGMLAAVGFLIAALAIGFTAMAWASFWMLVFQIWSGTLGADGRRYRRHRDEAAAQQDAHADEAHQPVPV